MILLVTLTRKLFKIISRKISHSISLLFVLQALFCFAPNKSSAQQSEIKFTQQTVKDGLSSNTVNAILKDRYGMLWIATKEGLNKFNGSEFKVYRFKKRNVVPYNSQDVQALCEDKSGRLWAGILGGSLYCYDRKMDVFKQFPTADWHDHLSSAYIKSICCDHLGRLWLATIYGLDVLDLRTKHIKVFLPSSFTEGSLGSSNIISVFEDSKKMIWVGTDKGLYQYQSANATFKQFVHSDKDPNSLAWDVVKTIGEDHTGHLWIGTSNGLSLFQPSSLNFRNFKYDDRDKTSISGNSVYAIAPDNEETIWIGTEGGLNIMNTKTYKVTRYVHDARDPFSLNSKSIKSIYIDPNGIYWLGTYESGIEKYDKNLTLFNLEQDREFDPKGLSASFVDAFAEKNPDNIFIGTDGGGLNLFHPSTGLFDHLPITSKIKVNTAGLPILCLLLDHRNILWIGTYQNGLFSYNAQTGSCKQYIKTDNASGLNGNDIFCLKEDDKGRIWIGTNGNGVDVYNPETNKFQKYTPVTGPLKDTSLPINGYIRVIETDHKQNIWIGSYGSGFTIFNPSTGKFALYNPLNTGLPIDKIISMLEDKNGNMWLGTTGDGVFLFNAKTHKISSMASVTGLPNATIHKILSDNNGTLWFSTDNSITSFDPKTQKSTNYSDFNGLQNNSFLDGSGFKSSDGTLFFGGSRGFNYFRPSDIKVNNNVPSVFLTSLKIDNKVIAPGSASPIHEDLAFAKTIYLDYKQNFSISYAALNYTLPNQNHYQYRLKGFDKGWNNVGTSTTAYYTNLDPGEYTFTVKAANNDGVWNNTGTSIKIFIRPPIWMTGYAYFLYALIAVGTLWFIRREGIRKLKIKQAQEEAKTRHELDLMKIKFLTNLSHEFRTPISLILAPAEKLLNQFKDQQLSEQLNVIKRNARRLLNLVNQLLDFRKLEENELKLYLSDGEITSFVKDLIDSFRDLSETKKILLTYNTVPFKVFAKFDHDKIERILFNLLSNAFKFTPTGGQVTVNLAVAETNPANGVYPIILSVEDTGIGLTEDKLALIFDRFYQGDIHTSGVNQGSGIGLSITKELINIHGGKIDVKSSPGKGTIFKVSLFLPALEYSVNEQEADETSVGQQELENTDESDSEQIKQNGSAHVLIVEDNEELRFYLAGNLKKFYKVTEAANGREGWHKALAVHPDLIVSDITMPFMDGIVLSRKIKADKRTKHIPIIILTALTRQEEELIGLETGVSDYLTKPFNFEVLNLKIRNLLNLNKSLKETYSKQIKVIPADIEIETGSEKFLKNIVIYIEENLNNPRFSVEDLSHQFGMSRGALYSKLLELTGLPPVEFIRSLKLDRAAVLLEKSDFTIGQIAYKAGFATPHYFTKSFKAKFDMLPSEYRIEKKAQKEMSQYGN